MEVDLEQIGSQLLAEFNFIVDDILKIPREDFENYGASLFTAMHLETITKPEALEEAKARRTLALLDFEKLCQAAPHVSRECMEAIAIGYGLLVFMVVDGTLTGQPTENTLPALLQAAGMKGYALAHAGQNVMAVKATLDSLKVARTKLAEAAADARHAPNRARKEVWKAWYLANKDRFKSFDQAAEVLSKEASVAWRTARDWITAWNRELRSTGKT